MFISSTLELSASFPSAGLLNAQKDAQQQLREQLGGASFSMVFDCSKNSSHKLCILLGGISASTPLTCSPFTAVTQGSLRVLKYIF